MNKKKPLINQIKVVINKLEEEYAKDLNSGVFQLIYTRYKEALEILENDENIKGITSESHQQSTSTYIYHVLI